MDTYISKFSYYNTFCIHLLVSSCLSRNTTDDFEMGGERLLGVSSSYLSELFLQFVVFELLCNSSCRKLIVMQIILVHRNAVVVCERCPGGSEVRPG